MCAQPVPAAMQGSEGAGELESRPTASLEDFLFDPKGERQGAGEVARLPRVGTKPCALLARQGTAAGPAAGAAGMHVSVEH